MDTDAFRRKLLFRSWHRGTREMDILMGRFAEFYLPPLDHAGLDAYARMLEENDPDLYDFYCGRRDEDAMDAELDRSLLAAFKDFSPV